MLSALRIASTCVREGGELRSGGERVRESSAHLEQEREVLSKVVYDVLAEQLLVLGQVILEGLARAEEG